MTPDKPSSSRTDGRAYGAAIAKGSDAPLIGVTIWRIRQKLRAFVNQGRYT
jgi:hypothetical protein